MNRIVTTEDVLGGEPRIEGRRISVLHIYERVEGRGLKPRTVAARHGLDVADVYRALAYYHENPDEIRAVQQRRKEIIEKSRESALTPGDADRPATAR
ncbi:MAG: DUF433 domain-containing protein [Euryarchaeota archaeon]|nr:DUF433 domain-containing protein [Euryarchaeota archaeon]